jgi:predicted serine/threonine protein phosphatase family protein
LDDFSNQSATEQDWLRTCAHSTQPPTLQWSDFAHLGEMRDMIQRYLGQPEKRVGINILIYGRPGCGKTEFAALLAQQTELPCYTLVAQDEDGETIAPKTRLHKCRLAHTMLEHMPSLLIFDEIEDVFGSGLFERSTADIHKPWINQILEHNPVPTVWLSNNAHCMDEAFLRRFDLVLEMPDLPRAQKAALIRKLGGDMLDEDHIQHFAKQENLLPALLERSFKVAKAVKQPENSLGDTARRILNQTLLAQGYPSIDKPPAAQAPYSLQWLNCDADIAAVSRGIAQNPHARICCYGAPGTGKTAWAKWLAEQAGLDVLLCKGSDLLGKYVGETEARIADAFCRAQERQLALIIDEADSFLFQRQSAERHWERSMVNEILTQIESFDGLLIISTNLMGELDPAVLRRFDLKIRFDWLTPEQTAALAAEQLRLLGLLALNAAQQGSLKKLDNAAPAILPPLPAATASPRLPTAKAGWMPLPKNAA